MMRIGVAQFKPGKGDYAENLTRVGDLLRGLSGRQDAPELLVFPEAALTGYLLEGGVRDLAVTAGQLFGDLQSQYQASGAPPLDIAVGFYEKWRGSLYNSALYASFGGTSSEILHVHRKIFLPTYGVFDEERFVESGLGVQSFDTRFGRIAVLICEDAWHSLTPTVAAIQGAQMILVHSASPARGTQPLEETISRPANVSRWERISRYIAEEHGVWVATSQLVGFEGGKGFAGGSCIVTPRGDVLVRGPLWESALVEATIDFEEVGRARADTPLLADLQTKLPHLLRSLETPGTGAPGHRGTGLDFDSAPVVSKSRGSPSLAADTADPMSMDVALVERWLVEFLREEVIVRRGFTDVVIGLSGGVDSALVTYLAVQAFGKAHVHPVMLPYRTSSADSLAHAELVAKDLGLTARKLEITAAVDGYLANEPGADASRRGNVMARMRMIAIFDLAAKVRGLPLGTGNKTERLFGYFTWHGDDSPPINPIGDLFKTQVWALAAHVGVPKAIVEKPASADLVKGQTDEGDFGISYPKADRILYWLLRGLTAPEIESLGFTAAEVGVVEKRLNSTHWKRRVQTVAMLSPTAIGEYYLRPVDY
jgi:NAD+ synthase (glutamine-hydrolysing)